MSKGGDKLKPFEIISKLDYEVAKKANLLFKSSKKILYPIFNCMTFLLKNGFIYIVLSIFMVMFKSTRKIGLLIFISMIIGLIITNLLIKNIVGRPRPYKNRDTLFYSWWEEAGRMIEVGSSFPSGHTTTAMAVGVILFMTHNPVFSWIYFLIPIVIGFSRIYYMVHYLSDVIGGVIAGTISAILSFYIFNLIIDIDSFYSLYHMPSIISIFK